jgi:hypothetical protein
VVVVTALAATVVATAALATAEVTAVMVVGLVGLVVMVVVGGHNQTLLFLDIRNFPKRLLCIRKGAEHNSRRSANVRRAAHAARPRPRLRPQDRPRPGQPCERARTEQRAGGGTPAPALPPLRKRAAGSVRDAPRELEEQPALPGKAERRLLEQ